MEHQMKTHSYSTTQRKPIKPKQWRKENIKTKMPKLKTTVAHTVKPHQAKYNNGI
jgi:hypothetical protein